MGVGIHRPARDPLRPDHLLSGVDILHLVLNHLHLDRHLLVEHNLRHVQGLFDEHSQGDKILQLVPDLLVANLQMVRHLLQRNRLVDVAPGIFRSQVIEKAERSQYGVQAGG